MTQAELMDLITHVELMRGLEQAVPKMKGIFDKYLKSLSSGSRSKARAYLKRRDLARTAIVKLMEKEGWGDR